MDFDDVPFHKQKQNLSISLNSRDDLQASWNTAVKYHRKVLFENGEALFEEIVAFFFLLCFEAHQYNY